MAITQGLVNLMGVFYEELSFVLLGPVTQNRILRFEQQCGFEINKGPFMKWALTETSSVIIIVNRLSMASGSLGSNNYLLPFPHLQGQIWAQAWSKGNRAVKVHERNKRC